MVSDVTKFPEKYDDILITLDLYLCAVDVLGKASVC